MNESPLLPVTGAASPPFTRAFTPAPRLAPVERTPEVQTVISTPEAASVAASRVLAHAALQAFSYASFASQRNRAA